MTDSEQKKVAVPEPAVASFFTAGARPFILWICGAALAYQYLLCPLAVWVCLLTGHPVAKPPVLDDTLYQLLFGMLGLGGLRTVEKIKGVAR